MATKPHLCQFLLTEMGEIYSRKLKRWFPLTATRTSDWSRAGAVSSLGAAPQLPQMTRSCPKHQTRHNGDRKPSEPSRRGIDRCRPSRHIPSFDITELLPLTVKSHTECAERSLALLGHNQFKVTCWLGKISRPRRILCPSGSCRNKTTSASCSIAPESRRSCRRGLRFSLVLSRFS